MRDASLCCLISVSLVMYVKMCSEAVCCSVVLLY